MAEHLDPVGVLVSVTPSLMEVVQQLGEVTVMVVDKVLVKELVKPLAPDLVEEKEVTMEEVMDRTKKER